MKRKIIVCIAAIQICSCALYAQVPVREEPRHKPVLQNKYFRLLDVWMPPGDTSLYHIHATPSLFLYLSDTKIGTQIKDAAWVEELAENGKAWYRSFTPDIAVHRVTNADTTNLHVTDIELLSVYKKNNPSKALPFPLLFENEKAFAYQLTNKDFHKKIIANRGPMIAELPAGEVIFYNIKTKKSNTIKTGGYLYIEPGVSFYFSYGETGETNMVLFEIK